MSDIFLFLCFEDSEKIIFFVFDVFEPKNHSITDRREDEDWRTCCVHTQKHNITEKGHQTWCNLETHEDKRPNICVNGTTDTLGLGTGPGRKVRCLITGDEILKPNEIQL